MDVQGYGFPDRFFQTLYFQSRENFEANLVSVES